MDSNKEFDPKLHLKKTRFNRVAEDNSAETYYYDQLHKAFDLDHVSGDWLLDIGSGPCVNTAFFSSRRFKNVVLSDIVDLNRVEIVKWLTNDSDAHNWTPILNYVAKLESSGPNQVTVEDITKRTKEAVRAVIPIDITAPDPLGVNWFKQFDCLSSSLCLEGPSNDLEDYSGIIKRVTKYLKPGGYLVNVSVSGCSFYHVGDKKLDWASFKYDDIRQTIINNNYEIIYENELINNGPKVSKDGAEYDSQFMIVAKLKI